MSSTIVNGTDMDTDEKTRRRAEAARRDFRSGCAREIRVKTDGESLEQEGMDFVRIERMFEDVGGVVVDGER